MTAQIGRVARVPLRVSRFNPLLKSLLKVGVPLGPNGLITIRGRKSGLPRTTPVAIIEVSGRRWRPAVKGADESWSTACVDWPTHDERVWNRMKTRSYRARAWAP